MIKETRHRHRDRLAGDLWWHIGLLTKLAWDMRKEMRKPSGSRWERGRYTAWRAELGWLREMVQRWAPAGASRRRRRAPIASGS